MSNDLSWSEVRWAEHRSSPSANEPTMATTSTLLSASRHISADTGPAQHDWPTRPFREANQGIYAPQAYSHIQAPRRLLDSMKLDPRTSNNVALNNSRTPRESPCASPRPKMEDNRAGSISDRIDWQHSTSRRVSELQSVPNTLASNGMYEVMDSFPENRTCGSSEQTLMGLTVR